MQVRISKIFGELLGSLERLAESGAHNKNTPGVAGGCCEDVFKEHPASTYSIDLENGEASIDFVYQIGVVAHNIPDADSGQPVFFH